MNVYEITTIDELIEFDKAKDVTLEILNPDIKPFNELNYSDSREYLNTLSKLFFPAFISYNIEIFDRWNFNEIKVSLYKQIKESNFEFDKIEKLFKALDTNFEIFKSKYDFSFYSNETRLEYNKKKISIEDGLWRHIRNKYSTNKNYIIDLYISVRDNLLNNSNDIKSLIHLEKKNEIYRTLNRDSLTLKSLIEIYQKEFDISYLLYDSISELEYIKIYYLSYIESEIERANSNSKRIELGRMKEYLNNRLIELEKIPKIETEIKNIKESKVITPIKLELNQTQIVYLFQTLIEQKIINESINPKIWNLVSQYFIDANGKPIKNIHQSKDKLKNNKTGRPKKKADEIEKLVKDTKNKT